jgi:hypothetical protein
MLTRSDYEDVRSFSTLLPQGLLLDPATGVVLLSTPRWGKPTLALGCAWSLQPVNIETCDESHCLTIARLHESLLQSLPVGAALQVGMAILPATTAPAWEQLRHALPLSPVVQAQQAAIARGLPHRDGVHQGRLREVHTWVTLRLPVTPLNPAIPVLITTLLGRPAHSGHAMASLLHTHLADVVDDLNGVRAGMQTTLQAAGHEVHPLDGGALGTLLARTLDPETDPGVILDDVPLREQILSVDAQNIRGGWTLAPQDTPRIAQVLSLHHAPQQTYPGMLSAPRTPEGLKTPLALWEAWPGPLTVVVNVAVIDQGQAQDRLKWKLGLAKIQGRSLQNKELAKELETLLTTSFLTGNHVQWGRVHVVLWGHEPALARGMQQVVLAGRRFQLEFRPEPKLGSTLFLQTLPLGFDPLWPAERVLKRARHIPGANLAHLLPLYGGIRGSATASLLYLNQRGETVGLDLFDNLTNPHCLITGMSGGGKSYTVGHMVNQVLPLQASAVILDRLPSYKALCAAWEGHYIELDFNAPVCFNPFYGPLDNEHVAFLTAVLAEFTSGGVERLNREGLNVLADALAYFAQTWDPTRGEARLGIFVPEVLQTGSFNPHDEDAREVGKMLARKLSMYYGRGPYAGFFDGVNQVTIHPRLTVIELSRLGESPDLEGGILFILMHLLTQFFAAPERVLVDKYFFCDETVFLLKHPASAEILEKMGRTFRKLRTSATFLAQYAEDFNSPAGRVLRKGSPTMVFLKQEAEELTDMQALLKLTPAEHHLASLAQRHQGWSSAFLRLPSHAGGLIHLVPDTYTALMTGQDPQTRRARDEAIVEAGGDVRGAMAALMTRYPEGLTGGVHA